MYVLAIFSVFDVLNRLSAAPAYKQQKFVLVLKPGKSLRL